MTNLDSILKSRDINLLTKACIVKAMASPVVMYWCKNWTIKKADAKSLQSCPTLCKLKNWCFLIVVLERLASPLESKGSNQSIFKEISSEYSLKGLMLKLKLQYFGHLMWRVDTLEKTLILGKTEGRRRRGNRVWDGWMAPLTQQTWVWGNSRRWWRTGKPGMLQPIGLQRVGYNFTTE